MSLYDGIEVETAPMPEISPLDQEDSSTQENISEKSTEPRQCSCFIRGMCTVDTNGYVSIISVCINPVRSLAQLNNL